MSRAETCIPKILVHEGGFVNHPSDPGGATNKGITIATFRRYIKPSGTIADLKKLTTAQATIVYKRQYWDSVSADLLPHGVDYTVADFAVNSGPSRAAKYLQRVVGVAQDGKVGPATLKAVRARDPKDVIRQVNANRLAFMRRAKNRKTKELLWPKFGRGWQRRVDDVLRQSLKDTKGYSAAMPPVRPDDPGVTASPKPTGLGAIISALIKAIFGGRK